MHVPESPRHHGRAGNLVRHWSDVHDVGRFVNLPSAAHGAFRCTRVWNILVEIGAVEKLGIVMVGVGRESFVISMSQKGSSCVPSCDSRALRDVVDVLFLQAS